MTHLKVIFCFFFLIIGLISASQNLSVYKSEQSVEKTTEIFVKIIQEKGLIHFETVAHDLIAAERGVQLSPMREVLFEDADLVTSLIDCQPTTALDLPLKVLIWEEHNDVYLAFIDPHFMKKRFILRGCEEILDQITQIMVRAAVDTIRTVKELD